MKILEQTEQRLTLQHRPIKSWLLGVLLTLMGGTLGVSMTLLVTAHARLTCERSPEQPPRCRLRRSNLIGFGKTEMIGEIVAVNQISRRGNRGSSTHTINLLTRDRGRLPLLPQGSSSYSDSRKVADQIANFITSDRRRLTVQQNARLERLFLALMGWGLGGAGLFLAAAPVTLCVIDKGQQQRIRLIARGVRNTRTSEYALQTVKHLDMQQQHTRHGKTYRAILVLQGGAKIPIHQEYTGQAEVKRAIAEIEAFINPS
jgi:hypothetical protein